MVRRIQRCYPRWVITLVSFREPLPSMLVGMETPPGEANRQALTRRWARHPRCVGLARAELRTVLADWGLRSLEDPALLVLSELLTNAVRHAHVSPGREIETSFRREGNGVRIAVDDADSERWPELRDQHGEGGRGLILVRGLADRCGVSHRRGVGKSVWAVLTVHGEGWM
ncbi:ATP-binding protein [Streptomyces sp. NPDC001262]|uniref:ATP-binding protein n=1 Tax=unclassified Streptomyces TaxID=2593676 RepID=UPI0036B32C80